MVSPDLSEVPGHERVLPAGTTLFTVGETGDEVYFVAEGTLHVLHQSDQGEVLVGRLGPGDVVGEITAMIGGRRTATVRAGAAPVRVRELSAEAYGAWLAGQPDYAKQIADQARDRIDHTRVARVLTELVGPGHPELIDDVNELLDWTRIEAGQTLFNQADPADAAYIVLTGRLHLTAIEGGEQTLDVSIGRGDIVGELGVIEQAPDQQQRWRHVTAPWPGCLRRLLRASPPNTPNSCCRSSARS